MKDADKIIRKARFQKIREQLEVELRKFKIETHKYRCRVTQNGAGQTKAIFTAQNDHKIEVNCIDHDQDGNITSHNVPLLIRPTSTDTHGEEE